MGQTDQDVTFAQIAQTKQVTVPPFFMDQTAITNSQYRQFVNWVRDSIAITNFVNDPKYYMVPAKGSAPSPSGKKYINWAYVKKNPVMSPKKGNGAASAAAKLQGMYYQGDDRLFDRNELDVVIKKTPKEGSDSARRYRTATICDRAAQNARAFLDHFRCTNPAAGKPPAKTRKAIFSRVFSIS